MTPHPTRRLLPELLTRAGASRRDPEPARRVVRTRIRKTHPGRRDHDVAATAPRTLPKTATRGVSKVEAPLERPRAVGRVKRPRRRRAGDPSTRSDASSASTAHVELSNASMASSSSQYALSDGVWGHELGRWLDSLLPPKPVRAAFPVHNRPPRGDAGLVGRKGVGCRASRPPRLNKATGDYGTLARSSLASPSACDA